MENKIEIISIDKVAFSDISFYIDELEKFNLIDIQQSKNRRHNYKYQIVA